MQSNFFLKFPASKFIVSEKTFLSAQVDRRLLPIFKRNSSPMAHICATSLYGAHDRGTGPRTWLWRTSHCAIGEGTFVAWYVWRMPVHHVWTSLVRHVCTSGPTKGPIETLREFCTWLRDLGAGGTTIYRRQGGTNLEGLVATACLGQSAKGGLASGPSLGRMLRCASPPNPSPKTFLSGRGGKGNGAPWALGDRPTVPDGLAWPAPWVHGGPTALHSLPFLWNRSLSYSDDHRIIQISPEQEFPFMKYHQNDSENSSIYMAPKSHSTNPKWFWKSPS
jgi:hypothetical protein